MKSRTLFLLSALGYGAAYLVFRGGLFVFEERRIAIGDRKEASGEETVYLSELEHASRAAEYGALVAAVIFLISTFVFARAVRKVLESRKADKN